MRPWRYLWAPVLAAWLVLMVGVVPGDDPPSSALRAAAVPGASPLESATDASFHYEVLPGLQPGVVDGLVSTFTPGDLTINCGWHTNTGCYSTQVDGQAIDLGMPGAGGTALQPVYAVFRAVDRGTGLTAAVSEVVLAGECKKAKVRVKDSSGEPIAEFWYTHILPSVRMGNAVNLPVGESGVDAITITLLGVVARIQSEKNVEPHLEDACDDTTGAHLHQRGLYADNSLLHANRTEFVADTPAGKAREAWGDINLKAGTLARNGFPRGYHPDPGKMHSNPLLTLEQRTVKLAAFPRACSDTWVFSLQSSTTAPSAGKVAPCPTIAAPRALQATPGERSLDLAWSAPTLPQIPPPAYAITGYEVRHKLSSAATWPRSWTAASGTSHTVSGLTAGTSYDVEVRAVSDRLLRSGTVAASATPLDTVPPRVTCTVTVKILDENGNPVIPRGVSVTGGGEGACGERTLTAVVDNHNYLFTGWSEAGCSGTPVPATCTVSVDATSDPVTVRAAFTRKHCTVTGNVETLDRSGETTGTAGGRVNANGTDESSATVLCGYSVRLVATANHGYAFQRWSPGPCAPSTNPCTVTTNGASGGPPEKPGVIAATATFKQTATQCTVSVSAGQGGTVTNGGTTSGGCPVSVSTTATPDAANGYTFDSWTGDSTSTKAGITVTATASSRTKSVTATFKPPQCTVSVSAGQGGTVTNDGTTSGDCPVSVSTTATPDATNGYTFDSWTGDSTSTKAGITVTATASSRTKSVTATFKPPQCTVSVSAGQGGSVTNGGTTSGDCPVSVSTTATPDTANGYTFASWTGDSTSTKAGITVTATASSRTKSVTATFKLDQCEQKVVAKPPAGAQTLGGAEPYKCSEGPPKVTQTADACYTFTGWTFSTSGTVRTATANYAIKQYTLTPRVLGEASGGRVSFNPPGGTYDCQATPIKVTATATPLSCYTVAGSRSRTFTMDRDRTALFRIEERMFGLFVSVSPPYATPRLSPAPPYRCTQNTRVTVTLEKMYPSYRFVGWSGACSGRSCTVTMNANKSATATLAEDCTIGVDCARQGRSRAAGPQPTVTYALSGAGQVTATGPPEPPEPGTSFDITLTANWDDATHAFSGWGGDCSGTSSTCVLTIDGDKKVEADFVPLPPERCADPSDDDCLRAVYRGAPGDYAQVTDIPDSALLVRGSDGRYLVRAGEQVTVVTAPPLPEGSSRFHLGRNPSGTSPAVSAEESVPPRGTAYTFTVPEDAAAGSLVTFELRPGSDPEPGGEPAVGDVAVRTGFRVAAPDGE